MKTPELYFIDGALPETPVPDRHAGAVGRDPRRRQGRRADRRLRAAQRRGRLPLRRGPPGHALRRDPALPARPREGRQGGRRRRGDDARRARRDHRRHARGRPALVLQPHRVHQAVRPASAASRARRWPRSPPRRRSRRGTRCAPSTSSTRCSPSWWTSTRRSSPAPPPSSAGGNRVGEPETYSRGDVARGFAEADTVLEATYRTAAEIHTPMELHGCVASWDGPRLTIWESTQGVYPVQQRVAMLLEMPLANVRVIGRYMGGGVRLQAPGRQVRPRRGRARQARGAPGQALPHARGDVRVRRQPAALDDAPEGRRQEGRHAHGARDDGPRHRRRLPGGRDRRSWTGSSATSTSAPTSAPR